VTIRYTRIHIYRTTDLLDLRNRFWGKPLDQALAALPDTVGLEFEGEEKSRAFRAKHSSWMLIFSFVQNIFESSMRSKRYMKEYHKSHLAVVTGQPGIGVITLLVAS
jgi:hypothetical protein